MEPGDTLRLRTMRHYGTPDQRVISLDFSAPKDQVFVVLLLGAEPKDGSAPLDIPGALDAIGWERTECRCGHDWSHHDEQDHCDACGCTEWKLREKAA